MKLEDFSVKQLKAIIAKYNKAVGVKGYSKFKKDDLIKHLRSSKNIKITETEKGVKIVVVNTIMEEDKKVKEPVKIKAKIVRTKKEKKVEPKKDNELKKLIEDNKEKLLSIKYEKPSSHENAYDFYNSRNPKTASAKKTLIKSIKKDLKPKTSLKEKIEAKVKKIEKEQKKDKPKKEKDTYTEDMKPLFKEQKELLKLLDDNKEKLKKIDTFKIGSRGKVKDGNFYDENRLSVSSQILYGIPAEAKKD